MAARKSEVDRCSALTKEMATKGRAILKKAGEDVPDGRKASLEDNAIACRAYLDHCCSVVDREYQKKEEKKAMSRPKKAEMVEKKSEATLSSLVKRPNPYGFQSQ